PLSSRQTIRSAFAELAVPIIGPDSRMAAARRLELSLAGRFDDYSSFGSSFDPRFGLMWEPLEGLRLRGSYGTSYRAPGLIDYDITQNSGVTYVVSDASAPGGAFTLLQVQGISDRYSPQKSKSVSLGFELTPVRVPGLKVAGNYFDIRYRDQIAYPP